MTDIDRLILARCFLYLMRVLFAILYAVTSRTDEKLFKDYEDLARDLKRWCNWAQSAPLRPTKSARRVRVTVP